MLIANAPKCMQHLYVLIMIFSLLIFIINSIIFCMHLVKKTTKPYLIIANFFYKTTKTKTKQQNLFK